MKLDLEPRIEAGPSFMFSLKEILRRAAQIVNTLVGYFQDGVLGVPNGGTGASTAASALASIGAVARAGDTMTGNLTIAPVGAAGLTLSTNDMASNNAVILGQDNGSNRWAMELGVTGSANFALSRFNGGTFIGTPISINWATGAITLVGGTTVDGQIYSESAARINGYVAKAGTGGGFGANTHNWFWSGSAISAYVDNVNVGTLAFTSDERVKHTVNDLVADRAAYLLIRPKSFHYQNIGIYTDNGEHWGFSAQNLLECVPIAVQGSPDALLDDGTPQPMNVQDRPILAQTVLHVQQLIATTEAQAQLIAELRAEVDILKGA